MNNQSLRILLAEDEAMVLFGFKMFLNEMGHSVVGEAYDGEMAINLARQHTPDLLIMDVRMPVMDGIRALEIINSQSDTIIPCIFVKAYSDLELIEKAKEAGAFNYLIKPISFDSLRAAIEIAMVRFKEYKNVHKELVVTKNNLENRKFIEKAKGILMEEFNFREQQAMEYMQKKSRNSNKKLVEVAKEIIRMNEALALGK